MGAQALPRASFFAAQSPAWSADTSASQVVRGKVSHGGQVDVELPLKPQKTEMVGPSPQRTELRDGPVGRCPGVGVDRGGVSPPDSQASAASTPRPRGVDRGKAEPPLVPCRQATGWTPVETARVLLCLCPRGRASQRAPGRCVWGSSPVGRVAVAALWMPPP